MQIMNLTRRSALTTIASVGGVTALAGCSSEVHYLNNDMVSWIETGIQKSETDDTKTASAYVVGKNTSEKNRDIIVDIRVALSDGTLLTDWRRATADNIPAGKQGLAGSTFELSRSGWWSPNEPVATESSEMVLFRLPEHHNNIEDGRVRYIENGEVKFYSDM